MAKTKNIQKRSKKKINKPRKDEYDKNYLRASKKEKVDAVFRRAGLPAELRDLADEIPQHIYDFYLS